MSRQNKIRKQLYITPEQERLLKERAAASSQSEAEIVREALESYLTGDSGSFMASRRREALRRLLELTDEISRNHRFPEGYKFDRDEVYAERMARITRSGRGERS